MSEPKSMADVMKAFELGATQAPGPRKHWCGRCARNGFNVEAERFVTDGRVHYAGLCRQCSDIEWTARWDAAWSEAEDGNQKRVMVDLLARLRKHMGKGRKYLGHRSISECEQKLKLIAVPKATNPRAAE